jgi:outer membrane murein-binding lipoprotein Lpp
MSDLKELDGIDDTAKREGRKTIWLYVSLIALAIIVAAIVPFILPINPGISGGSSAKINQMGRLAAKIGRLETEVREKQDELFDFLKKYRQKTGEPPPALNGLGLSEEEKKTLEYKIINVKSVSIKSLLRDILDRDSEISILKNKMKDYEAILPEPYIATGEKSHYQIAMDFLIKEKKVKKDRAIWFLERTALFDPIIPGFIVWNFYSGDEFSTFVTQGNADISPNELRRAPEKYLGDGIAKALAKKEKLTTEIKELKSTKDQLVAQVGNLQEQAKKMEKRLNNLSSQNLEMLRVINSLFFMVDLEENLIKRGIIKKYAFLGLSGLPKLQEISPEYFNENIDLRKTNVIEIHASQFNLSNIKKITIYPRFYKREVDYKVKIEENNQKAELMMLAIEKFKGERVIISVE